MDEWEDRLVLRAQAGDPRAFDLLLGRHEQALFRHAYRILGNEEDAYEALQEAFLVAVRRIRALRSRCCFRAWLFGVTTRVCLKQRDRRGRHPVLQEDLEPRDPGALPDTLAAEHERMVALAGEVSLLSPRTRAVILLHFFEGLSLPEVAAALEISLGTVKSRLAAGLDKLRRQAEGASS